MMLATLNCFNTTDYTKLSVVSLTDGSSKTLKPLKVKTKSSFSMVRDGVLLKCELRGISFPLIFSFQCESREAQCK